MFSDLIIEQSQQKMRDETGQEWDIEICVLQIMIGNLIHIRDRLLIEITIYFESNEQKPINRDTILRNYGKKNHLRR